MTTSETVMVMVLIVLLSVFFALCIAVMVVVLNILNSLKRVSDKAESVINDVESVTDVITQSEGKLTLLKLIANIVKLSSGKGGRDRE